MSKPSYCGLDDERLVSLGAQPLIQRVANEVQREEDVFAAQLRRDVEAEDVLVVVAGGDGGEASRAESLLELPVDARIVWIHDDHAVLQRQLQRLVIVADRNSELALIRLSETSDQRIGVVAAGLVNTAAGDSELVTEIRGDRLTDLLDGQTARSCALDLRESFFDFG